MSRYHGFDIAELPPPSQAWAADEMLNILEACVKPSVAISTETVGAREAMRFDRYRANCASSSIISKREGPLSALL